LVPLEVVVDLNQLKDVLSWCVGFNYAILIIWFAAFALAHDGLYKLHGRWFKIPISSFDAIHYAGMAIYKIGILLFFLVPLLALHATS
jgi:hypothetical protein